MEAEWINTHFCGLHSLLGEEKLKCKKAVQRAAVIRQ